ncbi:hypothetical protein SeLEV6574_g01753 [Synchytrium endobioticum]|uniref:Uncharacterized protein n=1 Tax=Synchytrium endobioticum TaxID=286115 RepID=A0A507DBF1_9FUNG|nr:hypothetical protein SeLEV6574_g01753 [Synchytrium endobioticum]
MSSWLSTTSNRRYKHASIKYWMVVLLSLCHGIVLADIERQEEFELDHREAIPQTPARIDLLSSPSMTWADSTAAHVEIEHVVDNARTAVLRGRVRRVQGK